MPLLANPAMGSVAPEPSLAFGAPGFTLTLDGLDARRRP